MKLINIFSTILTTKKFLKKKRSFQTEDIIKAKKTLMDYIDLNKDNLYSSWSKENRKQDRLNEVKTCKRASIKRTKSFDNNLILKMVDDPSYSFTLKEIREEHLKQYPLMNFSIETLRRHMKDSLNLSFGKIPLLNIKSQGREGEIMDIIYSLELSRRIDLGHKILYQDESSFKESKLAMKTWFKKSSKNVKYNNGRGKTLGVMAAISSEKVLLSKIHSNTFTSQDFIDFMIQLEENLENKQEYKDYLEQKKITLVCDNSRLHTSKKSINELEKLKIQTLFQPSYRPNTNSVELMWNHIKNMKSRQILRDE